MTVFTVSIEADRDRFPHLLSNGDLPRSCCPMVATGAVWHDPWLKPCYLFALVAGDFAVRKGQFTTQSAETLIARGVDRDTNISWIMPRNHCVNDGLGRADTRSRIRLGSLQRGGSQRFQFWSYENKSLNVFNTKYVLVDPDTAVDQDYVNVQAVIGHEYF